MFELFDHIVLIRDLPDKKLKKGDVGTVVMIHGAGNGYEVEFFTLAGETVAVETLSEDEVRPVHKDEVTHVRQRA